MPRRTNLEYSIRKSEKKVMHLPEIIEYMKPQTQRVIEDPYIVVEDSPVYIRVLKGETPIESPLEPDELLKLNAVFELYAVDNKRLAKMLSALVSECGGELVVRHGVKHTYYVVPSFFAKCVVAKIKDEF